MKKILLLKLALTMLVVNIAQAMDKAEEPNIFRKSKNIAINTVLDIRNTASNTLSDITNGTFTFIYDRPLVAAVLIAPLIPDRIAPFRRLALSARKNNFNLIAYVATTVGILARTNLLDILSHQYLIENKIEHKVYNLDFTLLNKCTCNQKIEKAK